MDSHITHHVSGDFHDMVTQVRMLFTCKLNVAQRYYFFYAVFVLVVA
jgi:hypothetical protein